PKSSKTETHTSLLVSPLFLFSNHLATTQSYTLSLHDALPISDLDGIAATLFGQALRPRHAHYLPFNDAQGNAIDAGIVLYFKAPHSYTGEDVLELQGHGGPAVLRRILARCKEVGKEWGMRHA